jgi:hypothetical protein
MQSGVQVRLQTPEYTLYSLNLQHEAFFDGADADHQTDLAMYIACMNTEWVLATSICVRDSFRHRKAGRALYPAAQRDYYPGGV